MNILKQPRPVLAVAFACVVTFMGIGLVDPILKPIADELGAGPGEVSLLFTSYMAVMGLAMLVTGVVSSRIGPKRTLLSGLAPAWLASRRQVAVDLRQTAQSGGLAHARMRSLLVVMQIALSLALLTMCGLFTRSAVVVAGAVPPQLKEIAQASLDVSSFNGTAADSARQGP